MPTQRGHKYRGPALVLAGLIWAAGAAAQVDPSAPQAVSAAECLQPPAATRGQPVYPPLALERKLRATVDVDLVFEAPDAPPKVVLLSQHEPLRGFVRSVEAHVAAYRLPCMTAGGDPVRLRQIFEFTTLAERAIVQASRLRETPDTPRKAACLMRIGPDTRPEYPASSEIRRKQGKLYVEATFTRPDKPPEVRVLATNGDQHMLKSVNRFMSGYRMPCLEAGSQRSSRFLYHFIIPSDKRTLLADPSLTTWLGASKSLRTPAYFDLNAMGCPFDVALQYWRPHQANDVAEIGPPRPERTLFLDWLAETTLNLDDDANTALLGENTTITVPCGRIALEADLPPASVPSPKPQE